MSSLPLRVLVLTLTLSAVAAACTPSESDDAPAPTKTTTTGPTTTASPPSTDANGDLLPPTREDPSIVAADVLADLPSYEEVGDPPTPVGDLLMSIDTWLPDDLVAGEAQAVYTSDDGSMVAVVSVIPDLTWRGDPGFVQDLIDALTGSEPEDSPDGIYSTRTGNGASLQLWSTGDGFVVASSLSDDAAADYLAALGEVTGTNTSWADGDCLFLEEDEALPYAPFPKDVVVPCSGAHNAEVLIGMTVGTDLDTFDADAIDLQRNYDCDKAYNQAFGDQRTHAPSLVTYMPDSDEWDRGDRYLACVVTIDRNEGRQLIAGPMADRTDLSFTPGVGSCFLEGLPAETIDCSHPHVYQYVGDATVEADSWPEPGDTTFDDACEPFLEDLEAGPATIEVFPSGLGPYAFENGDRTIRCLAFATDEGFLVDVLGGFDGPWRLLGTDGVAT